MGFNVVALAQKPRTRTLIVDSDLNMGNYDLIATDVKGDTAEFTEFVGGVGNFTSGLFSGGVDVSGILHAEGNTQVDGNLLLEGSINNVNIDDNGNIVCNGITTPILNLPVATSGNFAIGSIGGNSVSRAYPDIYLTAGQSTSFNFSIGSSAASTIPSVFNIVPPDTFTCTITFASANYLGQLKAEVYQNGVLLDSTNTSNTITCNGVDISNDITVVLTNVVSGALSRYGANATISINSTTYYLV